MVRYSPAAIIEDACTAGSLDAGIVVVVLAATVVDVVVVVVLDGVAVWHAERRTARVVQRTQLERDEGMIDRETGTAAHASRRSLVRNSLRER